MLLLEDNLAKYKNLRCDSIDFLSDADGDAECSEGFSYIYSQVDEEIRTGVSKVVIIPHDSSYVLKIPYRGAREGEESWDFHYAGNEIRDWDYCETEAEIYDAFKDEGLECFLAKTVRYGKDATGYPLYLQEKCITSYDYECTIPNYVYDYSHDKTEREVLRSILTCGLAVSNNIWNMKAIMYYGVEKYIRFMQFCMDRFPDVLNDLHSENYGYRTDGSPVLIDFSSWND